MEHDLRAEARKWFRSRRSHPLKTRGQHFMVSRRYLSAISDAAARLVSPKPALALEIGPGLGFLTRYLTRHFERICAVEIDPWFVSHLQTAFGNTTKGVTIIAHDFLDFSLSEIQEPFIVVGNLPYNLSTPILERLCDQPPYLRGAALVLQKEFADRAGSAPGSRSSGRLSLLVQNYFSVTPDLSIPPTAFYPAPRVHSRLLLMRPRPSPLVPEHLLACFQTIVKTAFSERRKMIRSVLSRLMPLESARHILASAGVPDTSRPESLTFQNWIQICHLLNEKKVIT
ncbi:MAG: 16S rRNA (adenine(1518)-N(6)/adenine(1519)-N(6))-dimethyltransferase RsmA [bacterium JZ-2024 1]